MHGPSLVAVADNNCRALSAASALTMSKVAHNDSAHSRTRPEKAEQGDAPRGMYLLRSTASSSDRNRSRQDDTTEKTQVMDQKLKQLSNENDYLQDTLKTLKRQQGSQSKPASASSRIRTIPSPVNDPSSAERVRERCESLANLHSPRS
jgi:hypothetical protein